ncbi:cytochrome P450 [Daldinia vernicosa]|uniref:cytochrome P450 n=1 Tax=Daldinia vernicosa TaxID=114800 RepID=UPI0020082B90|nr:cytochrome P450 [Daldinia vernicosa]KAI0843827.1 cytochrome P450 [Daldinia vernicosa]
MPSTLALVALGVAAIYGFLQFVLNSTQDAREPPVAERSIPFLSPIMGIIKYKTLYYNNIRKEGNRLPIYTLRLPRIRAYIINATELIPVLQRQWRTISFTPIMASAGQTALGMSQAGTDILQKDITSDSNSVVGLMPIMARVMAPGPSLNSMVRTAVKVMTNSIDKLEQGNEAYTKIKLYEWTRHEILMATTEAVFGPKNPYRDPTIESAWRTFEPSYLSIAISPLKPLTSPKAFQAREVLATSFVSYLENNGPETASDFIRAAHTHHVSHGFTTNDLARFEIGHTHAINGSTAPTTWWLLWHLYSDPVVLNEVRQELERLVVDTSEPHAEKTRTLDLSLLPKHTPILHSTLNETLRFRTMAAAVRLCLEDHLLDGKYLLKKGGIVIVPQPLHHSSTSAWGEDVGHFNHRRFIPGSGAAGKETESNKRKAYDKAAFLAFGGGHTLCPGRHFSTMEILAFAAMMVLRFDVEPAIGDRWVEPTWKRTPMVASLQIPDEDIEVKVRARDNDERRWRFIGLREVGSSV